MAGDTLTASLTERTRRWAVFGRYRRAKRARELGISGLGLGLYAARGIARAHRGEVTLFSAGSGTGTTAVLRLPVEPLA